MNINNEDSSMYWYMKYHIVDNEFKKYKWTKMELASRKSIIYKKTNEVNFIEGYLFICFKEEI